MKKSEIKEVIRDTISQMDISKLSLREGTPKLRFTFEEGKNVSAILSKELISTQAEIIVDHFRGTGVSSGQMKSFVTYIKKYIDDVEQERENAIVMQKMSPALKKYFTKLMGISNGVKDIFQKGLKNNQGGYVIWFNDDVFKGLSTIIKKQHMDEILAIVKQYRKGKFSISYSPKKLKMTISKV